MLIAIFRWWEERGRHTIMHLYCASSTLLGSQIKLPTQFRAIQSGAFHLCIAESQLALVMEMNSSCCTWLNNRMHVLMDDAALANCPKSWLHYWISGCTYTQVLNLLFNDQRVLLLNRTSSIWFLKYSVKVAACSLLTVHTHCRYRVRVSTEPSGKLYMWCVQIK